MDFTQAIYREVRSPADLIAAQGIWATSPVPNYRVLKKFLLERKQTQVGEQLLQDGLANQPSLLDLTWVPIEYAIGKSLLNTLGEGQSYPSYRDLQKQKEAQSLFSEDRTFSNLQGECDLNALDDEVRILRNYFRQ